MRISNHRPKAKIKDRLTRWIGFLALAALLAMATFPAISGQHAVATDNTLPSKVAENNNVCRCFGR